jgi:N-acetylneuraminic acid mutarotase
VNGRLYVLGGFHGTIGHDEYIAVPRGDAYDPATNKWARVADMPEPFTHAHGAVDGSTIWFVGGFVGNNPGPGTRHVWKYNAAANAWSRGPDLPAARGAGAAAVVGRELHFVGGMTADRSHDVADHWVLDLDRPSAGWARRASMPQARNHLAAVSIGGKFYAVGGQLHQQEDQVALATVERYDPATDKWTRVASMPGPRSHIAGGTFVLNGRVIVVGGETAHGQPQRDVFAYDPSTNKWSRIGALPSQRSTVVAGAVAGRIVLSTGNSPASTNTTWIGALT